MRECGYAVAVSGQSLSFNREGVYGSYANGKFTARTSSGEEFNVDEIKVKFAQGCVRKAAQKLGWTVKMSSQTAGKIQAKGGW